MITFREIWNKAAGSENSRELKERDYLYASELGNSIFDTWHKMKAVEPTTPPNERSFRKFNAGHVWEWMVKVTLFSAGVLKEDQRKVFCEKFPLPISGRLDFIVSPGQKIDFDLKELGVPDFMQQIVDEFEVREFDDSILEIKSCSSMLFPQREIAAADNHLKQLYIYCLECDMPGLITYISKDDCLMAEHKVTPNEPDIHDSIYEWVSKLKYYLDEDQKPPLEPLIIKEDKFKKNWKVEYSNYLTEYGFETPEEYRQEVDPKIARWNRVLKRQAEGKDMTDDNKRALEEMEQL